MHQHPQLADPAFLRTAVRRYERCWLPLLAAAAGARTTSAALPGQPQAAAQALPSSPPAASAATEGNGGTAADCNDAAAAQLPLVAPLDVAWVWMAHAIAPVHYRKVQGLQQRMHCSLDPLCTGSRQDAARCLVGRQAGSSMRQCGTVQSVAGS